MSHYKGKPTIRYVVQHTFDNKKWDDVCVYEENCFALAVRGRRELCKYYNLMEKNLREHPERVWPMIGIKDVRLVKRTTEEEEVIII